MLRRAARLGKAMMVSVDTGQELPVSGLGSSKDCSILRTGVGIAAPMATSMLSQIWPASLTFECCFVTSSGCGVMCNLMCVKAWLN
jgi:hypothetical protein